MDLFIDGGIMMWPILGCTVSGAILLLLYVWVLHRRYRPSVGEKIVKALAEGNRDDALRICDERSGNAYALFLGDVIRCSATDGESVDLLIDAHVSALRWTFGGAWRVFYVLFSALSLAPAVVGAAGYQSNQTRVIETLARVGEVVPGIVDEALRGISIPLYAGAVGSLIVLVAGGLACTVGRADVPTALRCLVDETRRALAVDSSR